MKKLLITLLFAMLALLVFAQQGLFELSFGDSKYNALNTLEKNGFQVSSDGGSTVDLSPTDNALVSNIRLSFSDDLSSLESWTVNYLPQEDEDLEDTVISYVASWHGDDYYWDDFMEEYVWDLGDGHYVYAGYEYDYESYFVLYTTEAPDDSDYDEDYDY